jgi:hypothetical protein
VSQTSSFGSDICKCSALKKFPSMTTDLLYIQLWDRKIFNHELDGDLDDSLIQSFIRNQWYINSRLRACRAK